MGNIHSTYNLYLLKDGTHVHHKPNKGTFKKVTGEGKSAIKSLLEDKHTLYTDQHAIASGVFKKGKLPYGRLWKNGHNWFCGYLYDDLSPKNGTEWYPGTKKIKYKGSYLRPERNYGQFFQRCGHGKAYDRDGKNFMAGNFNYWRDPRPLNGKWYQEPSFDGWRLYEGEIDVDTPEYVCKGRIREGCLSGLYNDKPQIRFAKGVLEKGKFHWGYLDNGTRTEDLPDGRQKISQVRDYQVIDYKIVKKKKQEEEKTAPSAPLMVEIPATGEPDIEIIDQVEIEGAH